MRSKHPNLRFSLYLIGAAILLIGLLCAGLIYRAAAQRSNGAIGYEIVGGNTYEVPSGDSKAYRREMELYGGTSGILIADLNRWLGSLWHGKRLAYVLAIFSIGTALICFAVARDQIPDQPDDLDK